MIVCVHQSVCGFSHIAMEYCFGVDDKSEEDKSIRAIVKKKYLALKQSSGL